jgi:hypothetical protein
VLKTIPTLSSRSVGAESKEQGADEQAMDLAIIQPGLLPSLGLAGLASVEYKGRSILVLIISIEQPFKRKVIDSLVGNFLFDPGSCFHR